jgi:outer membrane cobalamin receptor
VINVITRGRDEKTHGEVALGTAQNSVGRARATGYVRFGEDAGVWTSVAGARGAGRDFYFSEYAGDAATHGNAIGVDGFDAGTVTGRAWYKALTLQWLLTSRRKTLPAAEFQTIFGDPRTHYTDTRGLVELRFEPYVSRDVQLLTRASANMYNFDDELPYTPDNGGLTTEAFRGRWAVLEERVVWTPTAASRVTLGGEVQRHFLAHQTGNNADQIYMNRDDPFTVAAGYIVGDISPVRALKLSAGSRLDYYSTFGTSLNPRVAVIVRPYEQGNTKLLAGKAFRAPSVYESYYTGTTQVPAVNLQPEQIYSAEIEHTHRLSSTVSAVAALYTNYVTNLVVLSGDGTVANPNQYTNSTSPILTTGAEVELRRDWRQGWMMSASYAYQQSKYQQDASDPRGPLREVPNSPNHLGSVKGAAPIIGRTLMAMTRLSIEGPRFDHFDQANDPPQGKTGWVAVWDFVLSGEVEQYQLRYALGLYNAANATYAAPVSREFTQTTVPQNGRTVLATAQVSF